MFKPNYTITNKINNYIADISVMREVIVNAPLVPKWEINLRRDALAKSVHASTSIEGNPLSLDEVTDLMIGRDITALGKDKQEVLNYFDALNGLGRLKNKKEITKSDILKLHKVISKDVLRFKEDEGVFRTIEKEKKRGRVIVGKSVMGKIVSISFVPPEAKEVFKLMNDFINWLNSNKTNEMHPVLEAGITHYEYVRMHPHSDGNGRTARALATLVLLRREFDTKRFFTLDDFYNSNTKRYYDALKSVDKNTVDITEWLEYFCDGVYFSLKAVKDKIMMLTGGKKKGKKDKQVAIDERQIKIVEFLKKQSNVTNKDVRELLNTSNATAYSLLETLVKNEVIKKSGKGRSVLYVLA